MFFKNFVEEIGTIDLKLINEVIKFLDSKNHFADDGLYTRNEPALNLGKTITPIYNFTVKNHEAASVMAPIIEAIQQLLPDRIPFRSEISVLPPGKHLKWHHDGLNWHGLSAKIHVPLVPSPTAAFYFCWPTQPTKVYKYEGFEVGKIYNFNNRVPHAVNNAFGAGVTYRSHLIVDMLKRNVLDTHIMTTIEQRTPWPPSESTKYIADSTYDDYTYVDLSPQNSLKITLEEFELIKTLK